MCNECTKELTYYAQNNGPNARLNERVLWWNCKVNKKQWTDSNVHTSVLLGHKGSETTRVAKIWVKRLNTFVIHKCLNDFINYGRGIIQLRFIEMTLCLLDKSMNFYVQGQRVYFFIKTYYYWWTNRLWRGNILIWMKMLDYSIECVTQFPICK